MVEIECALLSVHYELLVQSKQASAVESCNSLHAVSGGGPVHLIMLPKWRPISMHACMPSSGRRRADHPVPFPLPSVPAPCILLRRVPTPDWMLDRSRAQPRAASRPTGTDTWLSPSTGCCQVPAARVHIEVARCRREQQLMRQTPRDP